MNKLIPPRNKVNRQVSTNAISFARVDAQKIPMYPVPGDILADL